MKIKFSTRNNVKSFLKTRSKVKLDADCDGGGQRQQHQQPSHHQDPQQQQQHQIVNDDSSPNKCLIETRDENQDLNFQSNKPKKARFIFFTFYKNTILPLSQNAFQSLFSLPLDIYILFGNYFK